MNKPVIILGGGFAGTILALRLKQLQPDVSFKLYEESSSLGGNANCIFRESDVGPLLNLLRPMINSRWSSFQFKSKLLDKWIPSSLCLIKPEALHDHAVVKLGSHIKLNNNISLEIALQESSFVIDTRDTCHFKRTGFVHDLSLEVELESDHYLSVPVLFDGGIGEVSEHFSYFPINDQKLIISHHYYSKKITAKRDEHFSRILEFMKMKGYKIKKVIEEKSSLRSLPTSKPYIHQENRVISLAAFTNPTTGCQLTSLSEIIDKMAKSSFRFGELKSLISLESQLFENKMEFYHYLNQQILKKNSVLEAVFDQSSAVIERFYQNKLSFLDRSKIIYGHSHRRLHEVAKLLIPIRFYPPIQVHKNLLSKV